MLTLKAPQGTSHKSEYTAETQIDSLKNGLGLTEPSIQSVAAVTHPTPENYLADFYDYDEDLMNDIDSIKIMVAAGDKEGAIRQLVSLLRQDGSNPEAWLMLGDVIDDPAKKKDCYNRVLKSSPNNPIALGRLRDLELSQPEMNLGTSARLQVTQPRYHEGQNPEPSQLATLGRQPRDSEYHTESEFVPSTQDISTQPTKTLSGTDRVIGIIAISILTFFVCFVILPSLAQSVGGGKNTANESYVTIDPQAQVAVDAVKNEDTLLGDNMHEGIALILTLAEIEGHTQSIDSWSVRKADGHYSVKFHFHLDGNHEYAEWWYYPDTEGVIPKNDWAFAFMGE